MSGPTKDTLELKRQLEKAASSEDVERIGDVLSTLDKVDVTLAILRESKVGATVSKLKKHANEGVSSSAKALVKKWKKIAEASGAQQGGAGNAAAAAAAAASTAPGKSEKPNSSGKGPAGTGIVAGSNGGSSGTGVGKAAASPAALSRQSSTSSTAPSEASMSREVDGVLADDGQLAPSRLRMRRKLFDTLLIGAPEDERLPAAHVAKGVECAMDTNNPYFTQKEDYLGKARQLVFNLKKNDQLRQDVREGHVAPERLVVMTHTELMSKDKREEMDKAVSDRTEARMLDWYDKNQDKINKQCGITQTEGMFECGRCKSTKTTYTQKQTRSADEPMTTFVTCSNCKNRWKFC